MENIKYNKNNNNNGLIYITHKEFEFSNICYGFFTKKGGVSQGDYDSLNCSFNSKDLKSNITKNRQLACDSLNIKENLLFSLNQCHSSTCANLNDLINNDNLNNKFLNADGIVTSLSNHAISILTADCIPILFVDTYSSIIGACHAGWKGTLSGIIQNTFKEMTKLGSKKENIKILIGPSIKKNNYQVSTAFKNDILNKYPLAEFCFDKDINNKNKYYFDLTSFAIFCAKLIGITKIKTIDLDTYSNNDLFFSYRRSFHENRNDTGRLISIIYLNNNLT